MTTSQVEKLTITCNDPEPGHHRVKIGDLDISNSARGAAIDIKPGLPPAVTVDMHLWSATTVVDGPAAVTVSDATATALVALGWTPPAEPAPEPTELIAFADVHISADEYPWLTCTRCEAPLVEIEAGDRLDALMESARLHTCPQPADATPEGDR